MDKTRHSLARLASAYTMIASQLLAALIFLALLNAAAYFLFRKPPPAAGTNAVYEKYKIDLAAFYPGMAPADVNALLNETWSRELVFEPFTQFTEPASVGRFVNVTEHGFRRGADAQPWPPSGDHYNVFFFGGSTTFGYGVADADTVPAQLEKLLSLRGTPKPVRVYNFGRSHYYSSQERALFAKLLAAGAVPDMAIFLDGLNDFYYADDEPLYSDSFRALTSGKYSRFGSMAREALRLLPVVRPLVELRDSVRASPEAKPRALSEYRDDAVVDPVIARYFRNRTLIRGLASGFGVKTLFVLQPVPTFGYDLARHPFAAEGFGRHGYSGYGYERLLAARDAKGAADFRSCAEAHNSSEWPHYADIVHYTATMSRALAACIYSNIRF